MNKLKYVQYSRKSSESKERQALSIADQNEECKRYAAPNGLNIVSKLEESKSAFKPHNRPQFDRMIELVKSSEANAILTWKPDRLCRNPEEGGKILQLLQDKVLREIRTATGEVYTSDSDHLVLQIHFGMANQYSRNLSQNVRRGLKYKCERGEYPRPAPLGFENWGETRRRNIRPHKFEASLIKKAFELAATAEYSLNYLVDYLHKKGLRTKMGKKISKSHVFNILTCPTHYGYFYHNGELYQGDYGAIISKRLFDSVQKALKDRSKPRVNIWNSLYNGLVKCAQCGCSITTTTKVKHYKRTNRTANYTYLHCTHRRGNCHQPPITLDDFEGQLLENVSRISIDKEVWELGIRLLKEKHGAETTANANQRIHLQTKYNAFQDKLNRLIDMRANEELTKEEFIAQKEILLQEQARIKSLLEDSEDSAHNWFELAENFLNTAFYAREVMEKGKTEEKRSLIMVVGENLFLKDKNLEFSFKKPFDILLQPEYRTNVLRG